MTWNAGSNAFPLRFPQCDRPTIQYRSAVLNTGNGDSEGSPSALMGFRWALRRILVPSDGEGFIVSLGKSLSGLKISRALKAGKVMIVLENLIKTVLLMMSGASETHLLETAQLRRACSSCTTSYYYRKKSMRPQLRCPGISAGIFRSLDLILGNEF
jgi:hypothetical protein